MPNDGLAVQADRSTRRLRAAVACVIACVAMLACSPSIRRVPREPLVTRVGDIQVRVVRFEAPYGVASVDGRDRLRIELEAPPSTQLGVARLISGAVDASADAPSCTTGEPETNRVTTWAGDTRQIDLDFPVVADLTALDLEMQGPTGPACLRVPLHVRATGAAWRVANHGTLSVGFSGEFALDPSPSGFNRMVESWVGFGLWRGPVRLELRTGLLLADTCAGFSTCDNSVRGAGPSFGGGATWYTVSEPIALGLELGFREDLLWVSDAAGLHSRMVEAPQAVIHVAIIQPSRAGFLDGPRAGSLDLELPVGVKLAIDGGRALVAPTLGFGVSWNWMP